MLPNLQVFTYGVNRIRYLSSDVSFRSAPKVSTDRTGCRNVYIVYGTISHSDGYISRNKTDERDERNNRTDRKNSNTNS